MWVGAYTCAELIHGTCDLAVVKEVYPCVTQSVNSVLSVWCVRLLSLRRCVELYSQWVYKISHDLLRSYLGHAWAAMPDLFFYLGEAHDAPGVCLCVAGRGKACLCQP